MAAEATTAATSARRIPAGPGSRRRGERITGEAQRENEHSSQQADHEQLSGRLENLRAIVPVFAQELAVARRQAAALRLENRRLAERIRELQRRNGARSR
jgi:hypothetical protein